MAEKKNNFSNFDSTPFICFKMGDENQSQFSNSRILMQSLPYRSEPDTDFHSVFTQRMKKKKYNNNKKLLDLQLEKLLI